MINWLIANKEWFFSGIGVFLLGLIINFFVRRKKGGRNVNQRQKSGAHSTNIQVGGDLKK